MPAYVACPSIALPPHIITTDEICDDIAERHPDHPKLSTVLRVVRATGVHTRAFTHPLRSSQVSGSEGVADRNTHAFTDSLCLAERAAHKALATANLAPGDIDAIVTSHTTSWAVPQLDIRLVERLGLRPDVRRIALATLGCIGGTQALTRAADLISAHASSRVLVVVAETLSTIYHHADTGIEAMIYKALFGDSAAATIVTSKSISPGIRIDDSWEYLLPDSGDRYWGRLDELGLHFDSTRAATRAPADVMPALTEWLRRHDAHRPDWALVHAGGPAILAAAQHGLGLTDEQMIHSRTSLAEAGNLGGASVLDVLARTCTTPPADGTRGVMLAYGPGFTTTALTGTWTA